METGIVKFFSTNERGGFGFLTLPFGDDLYFQRNDGGPVAPGKSEPLIQTWRPVREPRAGDFVLFTRSSNRQGPKAAPWCFEDEWNLTRIAMAKRRTFRLVRQTGHRIRGKHDPLVVWQGTDLAEVYQGVPLTTVFEGDDWTLWWFEVQKKNGQWRPIDGDPRDAHVQQALDAAGQAACPSPNRRPRDVSLFGEVLSLQELVM